VDALISLGQTGIPAAFSALLAALETCPAGEMQPGLALRIKTLPVTGTTQSEAQALVEKWAKDRSTKVGRAAAKPIK
jgi:hypothetical protein